jgi:ABC-type glycerol-3-phosphate transport system substrate-binding protein
MKKHVLTLLVVSLLVVLVSASCAPQTVVETKEVIVEKEVVVTEVVEKEVVVTEIVEKEVEVTAVPPQEIEVEPQPEIILWAKAGPEGDALKNAAAVYTRDTGNPVKVLIVGRSGYRQKYQTAFAAGSAEVDGVLDISRMVTSLAASGFLAPLGDMVAAEDYNVDEIPEIVQVEMKFEDEWYMAPTDLSEESLVYRTDLISSPPATWEELRENALNFTKSINPDSPTEYGYSFAGCPGCMVGTWIGIKLAYGADILDENNCVIVDSPEAIESYQFYIDLKNVDEVTPPDVTAWDYPELLVALQEGYVAQASFFTAGMPVLSDCDQTPELCENLAFVRQPAGPAGSWTRVNPLGIMVNAGTERIDAVKAFLSWLTGPDGSKLYTQFGGTSPRPSVLDEALQEERPWVAEVFAAAENGGGSLRIARASEVNGIFNKWADQALAGDISAEEALTNAADEIRELLDEANNPACQ